MRSVAEIFGSFEELDANGRHVNGTDKHGPNHRYGDAYEQILIGRYIDWEPEGIQTKLGPLPAAKHRSIREEVKLMMEVGVADGSCLLAWREIFPNATIVGMDVHPSDKAHGDRIEFHLGDQRSHADCWLVAHGRQFDLIVEDATHDLASTLLTLLYLWPFVKLGGMYVVEEFAGVDSLRNNITGLWPNAEIVDTTGPSGGCEPLVVFRKHR